MNSYSTWTGTTPGDCSQTFHLILPNSGCTTTPTDTVGRQALGVPRP